MLCAQNFVDLLGAHIYTCTLALDRLVLRVLHGLYSRLENLA
jgi:hypothetical protein